MRIKADAGNGGPHDAEDFLHTDVARCTPPEAADIALLTQKMKGGTELELALPWCRASGPHLMPSQKLAETRAQDQAYLDIADLIDQLSLQQ